MVAPGTSYVVKSGSTSRDILEKSAEALIGRNGLLCGPARVVKPSEPYDQQSKQSFQVPTSRKIATDTSKATKAAVSHDQAQLEPQPGASTFAAKGNGRVCSVAHHRGRTPICGLLHRKDFEEKRIFRKLLVDQKILFVVSRKSTWVPVKLVVEGSNTEYPYVDADGTRWYIKETFAGGIDNEKRSQVQWLLSYPNSLRQAVEECCPIRPRRRNRPTNLQIPKDLRDIIAIDD
jgi:hypothetical protein